MDGHFKNICDTACEVNKAEIYIMCTCRFNSLFVVFHVNFHFVTLVGVLTVQAERGVPSSCSAHDCIKT